MEEILKGKVDLVIDDIPSSKIKSSSAPPQQIISPAAEVKDMEPKPTEIKKPQKIQSVKLNGKLDYSDWSKLEDNESQEVTREETTNSSNFQKAHKSAESPTTVHSKELLKAIEKFKIEGNKAFKLSEFKFAISCYTKAIEVCINPAESELSQKAQDCFSFLDKLICPSSIQVPPSLYINRALCHIKLEDFESALNDCNAALDISAIDVKALYRKYQCHRKLRKFKEAKESLEKCILLSEFSEDNQKIVSLPILKNCLSEITSLILDRENDEKILKSVPSIEKDVSNLLKQLKAHEFDLNIDVYKNLALLFLSHSDSIHVFREVNGYHLITDPKYNRPNLPWAMLLASSCENVPENIRSLSEHLKSFLNLLCSINTFKKDDVLVLDSMLLMLFSNEHLLLKAEKLEDLNISFAPLVFKCLKQGEISLHLKNSIMSRLSNSLKSNEFGIIYKKGMVPFLNDLISFAASNLHQSCPFLKSSISFLFHLSLNGEASAVKKQKIQIDLIFESLINFVCYSCDNSLFITDALSTIYNLTLTHSLDQKYIKTEFCLFLCRSSSVISIKILAKLVRYDISKDIISIISDKINWKYGFLLLQNENKNEIGDWTQILASILKSDPKLYCDKYLSMLSVLIGLMKRSIKVSKDAQRLIGNSVLCLIEFASIGNLIDSTH